MALVFAALVAFGQASDEGESRPHVIWGPPQNEWPDTQLQPTVPNEMIKGLKVAGWPIALEKTELVEAQRHFGGTIGSRGDAGEALGWLCLYRRDRDASWVLWLESSEVDGPTIGSFRWQRLSVDSEMDRRCELLSKEGASISLPLALQLGMKEADVVTKLGKPSSHRGDTAIYAHEHSLIIHSEPYTLSNDVLIVYRNAVTWAIEAVHTTVS
jgi:hypothetical protein